MEEVNKNNNLKTGKAVTPNGFVCLLSIYFEWACQDFWLLKANLGPLCMLHGTPV